MSKNILDIEDDGGDVLFDEEEKTSGVVPIVGKKIQKVEKQLEDFGLLEQLTPKGREDFNVILTMLTDFAAPRFAVVIDESTDTIKFEKIDSPQEPELTGDEKIDLIYQITRRQMQELDELRQHVFTIEQRVTQRCPIMNLLSNMKKFILGGNSGRV